MQGAAEAGRRETRPHKHTGPAAQCSGPGVRVTERYSVVFGVAAVEATAAAAEADVSP